MANLYGEISSELKGAAAFNELKEIIARHKMVTLLYSAKDESHNQAAALKQLLGQQEPHL